MASTVPEPMNLDAIAKLREDYMPTLVNVVRNGLDAKMFAKMVEKVCAATIVANKATWPATVQSIDRHPEDENVENQG